MWIGWLDGVSFACLDSRASVGSWFLAHFYWKSLSFQLVCAFFTVVELFTFDVYSVWTFQFFMVFTMLTGCSDWFSASGPLPGKIERCLAVIMGGDMTLGGTSSWWTGLVIDKRLVLFEVGGLSGMMCLGLFRIGGDDVWTFGSWLLVVPHEEMVQLGELLVCHCLSLTY